MTHYVKHSDLARFVRDGEDLLPLSKTGDIAYPLDRLVELLEKMSKGPDWSKALRDGDDK